MSTPTWLNDVQALPSNENGAFASSADPSIPFMQTPTTASFEFGPLQHQQLQQRLQNGTVRNGSPAFNNTVYPTQSVVPAKRARPSEDGLGASPRPNPGNLPASRSQTPQQLPYQNHPATVNGGQHFQTSTPYQHFPQPNSNASLSPVAQNQQFNTQAGPQRLQTTSPSPFSPAPPNFGSQVSPTHSEHSSRVNTPQNGGQTYPQSLPYNVGPGQPFSPPAASNHGGPFLPQYGQPIEQRQRMHEIRMRQLQANSGFAQNRNQGGMSNPPLSSPNQMLNYPMALSRPQPPQQPARTANPEQFVRGVGQWMQQRGLPFNPHLTVMGRPLNLMQVFSVIMRLGGSKEATIKGQWVKLAESLQIPHEHWQIAIHEIQSYWSANLSAYESWWVQSQRQRTAMESTQVSQNIQGGELQIAHSQLSAARPTVPPLQDHQRPHFMHNRTLSQVDYQTPIRQVTLQQSEGFPPNQNGYMTPQRGQVPHGQSNVYSFSQPGATVPPQPRVQKPGQRSAPAPSKKKTYTQPNNVSETHSGPAALMPRVVELQETFEPYVQPLRPNPEETQTHGGVEANVWKGLIDNLLELKPDVPKLQELGVIDIQALTMSLRSGIHAEVRLALDTLALLSNQSDTPLLKDCEDLLDALIECAEEQVDLLAENAAEVSDVMLISSYEELARGCRLEVESLQEIREFGTLEYDLDRSVDRLICVTTILRNLSFPSLHVGISADPSNNQRLLAKPIVVKFIATVIRYLGTRNMLLRTYNNTLDFTKDIVIYLSNVSQDVHLAGKEEAFCILHFLLSFAPSPQPCSAGDEDISFTPYNPPTHRYYPPAIESLAKLLARDDPNRTLYRSIFQADVASSPPYDLLTRTFGLAIAHVPEYGRVNIIAAADARKVFMAQGLLAAEILAGLIPSSDHLLARLWLASHDGFAPSLAKLVLTLGQRLPQRYLSNGRPPDHPDPHLYGMITFRGLAVLRRLVEKAKDTEGSSNNLPVGIMPQRESVLKSLLTANMDMGVIRLLCNYSVLET